MPEFNKKPSFAVGYLPDGSMRVFAIGSAATVREQFFEENEKGDQSEFAQIMYFDKVRPEKTRKPHPTKTRNVNVDLSQFDGKEVPDEVLSQIDSGTFGAPEAPEVKEESPADSPRKMSRKKVAG